MDRRLITPFLASICGCLSVLAVLGCVSRNNDVKSLTERANEYKASQPDPRKKYWPNGRLKSEWTENAGFDVLTDFHENGVKSSECIYGRPGPIAGISWWDEEGVLRAATHHMMFTVVDLSSKDDEEVQSDIDRGMVWGPEGAYIRRNLKITDAGLAKLAAWNEMRWIDITGCQNITQRGIDEFKKALPNCEVRR